MLMVIQFVSKEVNCFLLLLKSCKNGVIDFLRQGDDIRGGTNDNPKIIFLISKRKHVVTHH